MSTNKTPCPRCNGQHSVWDRNTGSFWVCPECSAQQESLFSLLLRTFAGVLFLLFLALGAVTSLAGFWVLAKVLLKGVGANPF